MSYRELDEQANRVANALQELRLGKAAKVAVLSMNRPEYAVTYFGISRTKYLSVHSSTRSTAGELAYVLNKTEAKLLFAESRFLDLLGEALPLLDKPTRLVIFDPPDVPHETGIQYLEFAEFIKGQPVDKPDTSILDSDGLAITLTGGTTGLPKAVLVTHKARCVTAQIAAKEFGLQEDDVVIASTPLFHTVGLFVWFGTAVMLGATIVIPEAWNPESFMKTVQSEGITAAFLVPSQLNALVSHPSFDVRSLATLRNIGYAGAPMGKALFNRVRAALPHVVFTENYGQSEACPLTVRREDHGEEKIGTVGKPVDKMEIGIVGPEGNFLPPNALGDIVTRGDTVFKEYFKDPEETADAFRLGDGWLFTGDAGFLDEDGFLTLVDRSKDMLISGGENIYPAEIENALYQHEAVNECAVFGIPDETWGEVPAAYIVLASGTKATEEELIEFCNGRISRFKRPKLIKFVEALPKTAVGKIRKNALRDPYWEGSERKI